MGVSLPTSQAWNRRSPCCSTPGWRAGHQGGARVTCLTWPPALGVAGFPAPALGPASAPAPGPCAQPAWWGINTRPALHTDWVLCPGGRSPSPTPAPAPRLVLRTQPIRPDASCRIAGTTGPWTTGTKDECVATPTGCKKGHLSPGPKGEVGGESMSNCVPEL